MPRGSSVAPHNPNVRTSNVVGEDGVSVGDSVGGVGEGASRVTWTWTSMIDGAALDYGLYDIDR